MAPPPLPSAASAAARITILPTTQGTLALELAHEHQPDGIVLDLHLPDISGREALTRLRKSTPTALK